jgi:hypothetical protein
MIPLIATQGWNLVTFGLLCFLAGSVFQTTFLALALAFMARTSDRKPSPTSTPASKMNAIYRADITQAPQPGKLLLEFLMEHPTEKDHLTGFDVLISIETAERLLEKLTALRNNCSKAFISSKVDLTPSKTASQRAREPRDYHIRLGTMVDDALDELCKKQDVDATCVISRLILTEENRHHFRPASKLMRFGDVVLDPATVARVFLAPQPDENKDYLRVEFVNDDLRYVDRRSAEMLAAYVCGGSLSAPSMMTVDTSESGKMATVSDLPRPSSTATDAPAAFPPVNRTPSA